MGEGATYHYYLHGPLARVELGKNKVQGMGYAYTLQGVNGQFLDVRDMSGDGLSESPFRTMQGFPGLFERQGRADNRSVGKAA